MDLYRYDNKLVRITDPDGRVFRGVAESYSAEYCLHEYGREKECLQIYDYLFFEDDIEEIALLPTWEEACAAIPRGRYRHFKGNEYEVIAVAKHSETGEAMVIYRPSSPEGREPDGREPEGKGVVWARPADMWFDIVERDGVKRKRFEWIGET